MTDPRANNKQNWNYEATVAKVEKIINQLAVFVAGTITSHQMQRRAKERN